MVPEDYPTYGAYLRAKSIHIGYCGQGGGCATRQKTWDTDLDLYRRARGEGIQPETTRRNDVEYAMRSSDRHGVAYDAGVSGLG